MCIFLDRQKGLNKVQKKEKGKRNGETSTGGTQQSGHASRSNIYEPALGTESSQQSAFQTQFDTR